MVVGDLRESNISRVLEWEQRVEAADVDHARLMLSLVVTWNLPSWKHSWHQLVLSSFLSLSIRWHEACSDNVICLEQQHKTAYLHSQWMSWRLIQSLQKVLVLSVADIVLWLVSESQTPLAVYCGQHVSLLARVCVTALGHTRLPTLLSPCRLTNVW